MQRSASKLGGLLEPLAGFQFDDGSGYAGASSPAAAPGAADARRSSYRRLRSVDEGVEHARYRRSLERLGRLGRQLAAALAFGGILTAIWAAEVYHDAGYTQNAAVHVLKLITTVSTVALLLVIAVQYRVRFLLLQAMQAFSVQHLERCRDHPGLIARMVVEVLICALHAPVGVAGTWVSNRDTIAAPQSVDGTMTVVMLARLYLIMPVMRDAFSMNSAAADVIGRLHHTRWSISFTMRYLLDRYPFRSFFVLLMSTTFAFAYALRTFERGVCESERAIEINLCDPVTTFGLVDLGRFDLALWCTAITELTVGFGDT